MEVVKSPAIAPQYRGFSCPAEPFDQTYLEETTLRHYRKVARTFLDRFDKNLAAPNENLKAVIQTWLKRPGNFEDVWDVSFSKARYALTNWYDTPTDFPRRAAALALHLHERGVEGNWKLKLTEPTRLRWGPWLLPLADEIEIETEGKNAEITLTNQQKINRVHLAFNGREWQAYGAQLLPSIRLGARPITLLLPDDPQSFEFVDTRPEMGPGTLEAIFNSYQKAFDILENFAPAYVPWATRIVRQIVPTVSPDNEMVGGSDPAYAAAIHLTFGITPASIAEMIAHEATHQYFFLLSNAGPLHDGSDTQVYYSPSVNANRNLYYILLTYHAFGNVVLFYRQCRENGFDDAGYFAEHETFLLPWLSHYESILKQSRALTEPGRAIWEPLAEQLQKS